MAKDDPPGYFAMMLRRGEDRPVVWYYGPRDLTQPRYDLTGKSVQMRIKPDGGTEIVYTDVSPGISVTDAEGGEITIDPTGEMITAYDFNHAPYVILVDGKRILWGPLSVKGLYE